jgi:nucleoside-diphosphate-sugar epimerase
MILVTGGTGFIGSHLVERLLVRDERVRVLVRRPGLFENGAAEVSRGDLVSGEGIARALDGVRTVIHLAGVTKALSTADYYAGNVTAAENLVRAIAAAGRTVRMVHVSSLAAIGPAPDSTGIGEDAEPYPVGHYGKSKLEGELRVRAILPDSVIVRPPVVYGPRDTDVFQMLKSINQGLVVQIAGGEKWFSAIYVSDLVDGIIAAANSPRAAGRAYFLAHPRAVSWRELGNIAARIMSRTPRVIKVPLPAAYAVGYGAELWARLTRKPGIVSREKVSEASFPYWVCDTRRAREEIGFEASTGIDEGLANSLAWYREAGWLKWR